MKTGVIVSLVVVALALISIFAFTDIFSRDQPALTVVVEENNEETIVNTEEMTTGSGTTEASAPTIEITSSGFSPRTLTINAGDTVRWVNKDSRTHWPASAVHPSHTVYPGSSIGKCGSSEETTIFDACHSLITGEFYSFTFNEQGTWNYHDHLRSSLTGTIVVN